MALCFGRKLKLDGTGPKSISLLRERVCVLECINEYRILNPNLIFIQSLQFLDDMSVSSSSLP